MNENKIFMSHSVNEKEIAILLQEGITDLFLKTVDVFVSSDNDSLIGGEKWLDKIITELKDSDIVLVLASKNSIKKPWINFEAGGGYFLDRLVIPLCYNGMNKSDLPEPLSSLHARDMENFEDFKNIFNDISKHLEIGIPKEKDIEEYYEKFIEILKQSSIEQDDTEENYEETDESTSDGDEKLNALF